MFAWAVVQVALAATPAEVQSALRGFNARAEYTLPELSKSDLRRLVDGKVVKLRESGEPEAPQRAIGMMLMSLPRDAVWVAARTEEGSYASMSHYLIPDEGEGERWYQHMNVPFPFTDRHWVVDVWDNASMAAEGTCWERPWKLAPAGYEAARAAVSAELIGALTPKQFDASLQVPVNNGAWVVCTLGSQSLLVFHAQSVVGGSVPDRLVVDFTMLTLGKLMKGIESRASTADTWYAGEVIGGDGQRITLGG